MIKHTCSHCGGRKTIDGQECYVCLGKGEIDMTIEELTAYFRRFRERGEAVET